MSNLLYDALMLGRNKKVENEEYLVAVGKKQPSAFHAMEEALGISNVISDGEFSIHLFQNADGYFEIEVFCDDNFIIFDKKIITSDEFTDRKYDFHFMVISDRLHNGRNYSSIVFRTSNQNVEIPIVIDNKIRVKLSDINPRKRFIQLEKNYFDLHMNRIDQNQWSEKCLEILNEIPGEDEKALYLMLYKAQVYITLKDDIHAKNYIEHVGTQIPKLERKNYGLYCYFIYLASLYEEISGVKNSAVPEKEEEQEPELVDTADTTVPSDMNIMDMTALQKVHWVYSHYPKWQILWILFYMDPQYRADRNRRLGEMQEAFYAGAFTSPVMYLEALKIFRSKPECMTEAGNFEIQVLNFAVKYDFISAEIADRFASLILTDCETAVYSESEVQLIISILKYAYGKYSGGTILKALCVMLILNDCSEKENHVFFAAAIRDGIEEDEIYNFYIYTLDQHSMDQVPERVLNYFLDHTELLYEYRAYLYANIISNKYSNPECYRKSISLILKFAENQIIQGQNECLSIIYKEILENNLITANMKNNLYDVICTKEVICQNDRMKSVLVFHKELQVYQESIFRDGKAFVKIYTPDALLLFKDVTGNLYHHVDYKINHLVETKEYIDLCLKDSVINAYMLMGDALPILRACKTPLEILEFFTSNKVSGQFRRGYEQELMEKIVSYYAKNSKDDAVYDELLKFCRFELSQETRAKLIRIMIKRGLAEDAYREISEFGICGLEAEVLSELAHSYIQKYGEDEDALLTIICEAGYGAEGFDELVFGYLYKYYNGKIDLLIELYRSCNAYKLPATEIEERILNKAMNTGEHPEVVSVIFKRYYEEGPDKDLIHRYLTFRAELYLYGIMTGDFHPQGFSDLSFFDCMEKDLMRGCIFSDDSSAAFLLYRTELQSPDERQLRNLENLLKDLVRRGKMVEEFKYYEKYFELPSTLTNNIIVSAFSDNPELHPCIAYEIRGGSSVQSGTDEMEEIFHHCYAKYFTLFSGESVIFSMNGEESSEISYNDLNIRHDGSRYALLDDMIQHKNNHDHKALKDAAADYYVKEQLIDRLF